MALINNRVGTTSSTIRTKPRQCHTCKEYKEGIFRLDGNGRPQCYDCMPEKEKPLYDQS
jgi:hypothetical protein